MDFNSIDFGLIFLKQFHPEVVIYDYTKMSPDKNKLGNEGVHLIVYICDRYSLKLIYHETSIHFLITDQLYRYIDKKIFYPFVTRQHFTYYEDVVKFLIDCESKTRQLKHGFQVELPIEYQRQEKLEKLL